MKKLIAVAGIVVLAAVFFNFRGPPPGDPIIEGYIIEAGITTLLVADGITAEQAKECRLCE